MDRNTTIVSSAPGKVVLWGEYAVLDGSPAAVAAIDRYAKSRLIIKSENHDAGWAIQSTGVTNLNLVETIEELSTNPLYQDHIISHILLELAKVIDWSMLEQNLFVQLDTTDFEENQKKLGIGSSAAICVSTYAAFCKLADIKPSLATALSIHQNLQNNTGSGLDISAAWYGGILKFQSGLSEPFKLLESGDWRFFYSGRPSKTQSQLVKFRSWLETSPVEPLSNLKSASSRLFECQSGSEIVKYMPAYADALRELDRRGNLGIYSSEHDIMHKLASETKVAYKPCGAGGGDLGAAISDDPEAMQRFSIKARAHGFTEMKFNISEHGVHVIG